MRDVPWRYRVSHSRRPLGTKSTRLYAGPGNGFGPRLGAYNNYLGSYALDSFHFADSAVSKSTIGWSPIWRLLGKQRFNNFQLIRSRLQFEDESSAVASGSIWMSSDISCPGFTLIVLGYDHGL